MWVAIAGSRGLRGPGIEVEAGWPAQDRQQASVLRAFGSSGRGLGATSFFPQPFGVRAGPGVDREVEAGFGTILKGLILAQNERWRRGLGMQVARAARPVAQG